MSTPHPPRTSRSRPAQATRTAPRTSEWYPAYSPLPPRQETPPRRRRRRRWYARPGFWLGLLFFLAVMVAAAGAAIAYAVSNVPLPSELDTTPTIVLDSQGEELGQLSAQATRADMELAEIPEHTRQAVLAAEDAGFYQHPGVSIPGIVRAAISNVRSGEVRQGGSTISQQYVKTVTGETGQTALRKVREAVVAMKLEREVSKDQILEYYLNTIYFGRGAYGIQAAARAYFDKDVGELTMAESALLAGFIPAPSASDPVDHPARATERYNYVVDQLLAAEWIDQAQASQMLGAEPEVTAQAVPVSRAAPFFMQLVEQELTQRLGVEGAYRGLTVQTTLNRRMQRFASKIFDQHYDQLQEDLQEQFGEDVEVPTGAMVSLDPATGAIRALVGGRSFRRDQYNLAIGGPEHRGRQPGSTFKPFALAAWIDSNKSPESRFEAPATIDFSPEESGTNEGWEVANYGDAGYGTMTLREATWNSVNTVYAQAALEVGPERIAELANDMGVTAKLDANPSIVLGAEEVTPLDLASAYNTLASGGVARAPRTIESVRRDGTLLYEPSDNEQRVLDEDVAWTTVDVLLGVVDQGTGTAAQIGRPVAGKTGTTQNAADAWFAGFTPNLTTVSWMGYRNSNDPMEGSPTGGGFPAELWSDYMREAVEPLPVADFPQPTGEYEIVGEPSPEPSAPAVVEPEPAPEAPDEPETSEPAVEASEPAVLPEEDWNEQLEEARRRVEEDRRRIEEERRRIEDERDRGDSDPQGIDPQGIDPAEDIGDPWSAPQ